MRTRAKRLGLWKPYVPRDQQTGMGGDASLPASFAGCVVRRGENGVQTFLYASDHVDVVTGTRPVALFFNGEEYPLNGEWKNLPAQVCVALERTCPGRLRTLVARGEVAGFATSEARFRRGQYVPEAQVWYEKNAPSREFVRQTRKLCILFGADLSHIKVTYVAGVLDRPRISANVPVADSEAVNVFAADVGESDLSQLSELLEAEFANGVRIGSIIDRNKIRKAYAKRFGKDLPENFDLDAVLPKIGVVHDGKVFPRPSSKDGGWRTVIARLVGQGNIVFQFSRLMELHASEFMQAGIVSPEMLRETVVREAQSDYEISGELFAPKGEMSALGLLRSIVLPSDGVLVDVNAVAKRVPCVDVAFIRNFCKSLNDLVRVNQDLYAVAARIEFDDAEVVRGKADCEAAIKDEGFFSLSQLRLEDSATMNVQGVSDGVLRRVFFQRFLSDRFDAHGQIVCAKGTTIDGQIPLRAFLRAHSEVTLEQLESVAKEYKIAPWLALKTANEEMMRIDGDRFVAPALISFDVPSIDNAISSVCEDCITPFGDFANLSDFPAVPGFPWNEFLLESFLRRASMRFRLVSPSVAAKEAVSGAVVPCNLCEWSAENAFADIALRSSVAAEIDDVGDFLVATRCVLKRSAKTVGAVVDRMKKLGRH